MEKKTELRIEGMNCVSCEKTISNALKKVPGVVDANVSFVGGSATIEYGEADVDS